MTRLGWCWTLIALGFLVLGCWLTVQMSTGAQSCTDVVNGSQAGDGVTRCLDDQEEPGPSPAHTWTIRFAPTVRSTST